MVAVCVCTVWGGRVWSVSCLSKLLALGEGNLSREELELVLIAVKSGYDYMLANVLTDLLLGSALRTLLKWLNAFQLYSIMGGCVNALVRRAFAMCGWLPVCICD